MKFKANWRAMSAMQLIFVILFAVIALGAAVWWLVVHDAGRRQQGIEAAIDQERLAGPKPLIPAPQTFMPLTAEEAAEANEEMPFSRESVEPAPALVLPIGPGEGERGASVDCLTAAIYYEAANEPASGRRAVAQVVLNRVRHPAFPRSVCGVVYEGSDRKTGCQFTFTCDGSLQRRPSKAGWESARKLAVTALSGGVEPEVGMATHYHADFVVPYWAPSLNKITKLGHHIFYRWKGNWGRRRAFTQVAMLDDLESAKQLIGDLETIEYDENIFLGVPPTLSQKPQSSPLLADDFMPLAQAEKILTSTKTQAREASGLKVDERPSRLAADQKAGALVDQ